MFQANGVVLNGAEHDELRSLVESEDPDALAFEHLHPTGEKFVFSEDHVAVYQMLKEKGLVSGASADNGFFFRGLTVAGKSWIRDYDAQVENEERAIKSSRRHDFKVALVGAVAGGLLGLFSGAFSAWLFGSVMDLF